MNHVIKSVITAGGYKLDEMQRKIKKLYLLGDLTESQMDELLTLAAASVSVDAERPEYLTMLRTLAEEIEALHLRVAALEGSENATDETYPAWKSWDGISKDYTIDAIVSHNGQLWKSVFDGQNVWEPGASGDLFWVKHTA